MSSEKATASGKPRLASAALLNPDSRDGASTSGSVPAGTASTGHTRSCLELLDRDLAVPDSTLSRRAKTLQNIKPCPSFSQPVHRGGLDATGSRMLTAGLQGSRLKILLRVPRFSR